MAGDKTNDKNKKTKQPSRRMWLVDPIYRKFTAKAFRQLTSPEFFEFFMSMLKNGEQQFQFSNRRLKIDADETWIEAIEKTIPAFMEITRNPRVIITQEELITNVVQARKIDSEVVKHLCSHSQYVDAIDEKGEVVPSKILNIFKEETWDTYENRFVYTLLKKTYDFVEKRYRDMKEAMNDEFGANLLIDATGKSKMETIEIHSAMKIKQIDQMEDAETGKKTAFGRIAYLYTTLGKLMQTRFAKEMAKYSPVFPPLVITNAIKKNPYLRKCHTLWDFLLRYNEAGFTIEIIEQNPEINHKFEQDIYDNIMFTYLILKGYLEDNRDRALDRTVQARRRTIRPKYIREIIEEIVRDFNLSEVEVRKIMIEQLTKEQLLREEREERYRIIEEQRRIAEEKRRQEELERIRQKKEKEREAQLRAREKERERARREKEKAREALRLAKEKEKKAVADAKRLTLVEAELQRQMESIETMRARRAEEAEKAAAAAAEKQRIAEEKKKAAEQKKAEAEKRKAEAEKKKAEAKKSAPKKPAAKKPSAKKPAAKKQTEAAGTKTGNAAPPAVTDAADPAAQQAVSAADAQTEIGLPTEAAAVPTPLTETAEEAENSFAAAEEEATETIPSGTSEKAPEEAAEIDETIAPQDFEDDLPNADPEAEPEEEADTEAAVRSISEQIARAAAVYTDDTVSASQPEPAPKERNRFRIFRRGPKK